MSHERTVLRKTDLVDRLRVDFPDIRRDDIALVIELSFEAIAEALSRRDRVEIRGIGSFQVNESGPEFFRNPRSGAVSRCRRRQRIVFRPGKSLRRL